MTSAVIYESVTTDNPKSAGADTFSNAKVVYGVHAIAKAIDETDIRRTFYNLKRGNIPGARKIGRRWCLSLLVWNSEMHGDAA